MQNKVIPSIVPKNRSTLKSTKIHVVNALSMPKASPAIMPEIRFDRMSSLLNISFIHWVKFFVVNVVFDWEWNVFGIISFFGVVS